MLSVCADHQLIRDSVSSSVRFQWMGLKTVENFERFPGETAGNTFQVRIDLEREYREADLEHCEESDTRQAFADCGDSN